MTLEQVNKMYEQLCIKLGDAQYKQRQFEKEIKTIYGEIDKLNELAAAITASEATKEIKNE